MSNQVKEPIRGRIETICYHCGDFCRKDHVIFDEKDFCCNGCRTVYEILNKNNLADYYNLDKNPGITLKNSDFSEKFDYLDNREIQKNILSFSDEKISKTTFYIPSIHCSSCIWLLENLQRLHSGIIHSRVNFTKKEVSVDFSNREISLKELVSLLASVGYEPYISLEQENRAKHKDRNRGIIIRIGVAGFCFGNIMLLSFPEYFGFQGLSDILIQQFIKWLIVLLSLPVVFYCSTDYFKSALAGIRQRFMNIDIPISIGIIALFLDSLYLAVSGTGPGYFDSLAGLLFFLLIGKWVQNISYEGLSFDRDYKSYFPLAVNRMDGEKMEAIPVRQLQKGNIILIRNNEIIPSDSILLDEKSKIDYSFVTGESEPVLKYRGDKIYAGGRQCGPSVKLAVEKTVSQSYLTQLWNNEVFSKEYKSGIQLLIDSISKYFTAVILLIASAAFIYWAFTDIQKSFFIFTAVLIVACPCALSMATPFTLGNTLRVFGRNHFYLKNTRIIENLGKIDHIVFDKTGTLTENAFSAIEYEGIELTKEESKMVKSVASSSTHPLSRKIADSGQNPAQPGYQISEFRETQGAGIEAIVNNKLVKLGSGKFIRNIADSLNIIPENNDSDTSRVFVSINDQLKGSFIIRNQYRENLSEVINDLKNNYSLSILSGDEDRERTKLTSVFPEGTKMIFRQQPEDKLNYIRELQMKGKKVMMLGDGLNDAGALKISDAGIAVTEDITLFTPASDAIIEGKKMNLLPAILNFSKIARKVIIACFVISFLYNIAGIGFAVSGRLSPVVAAILMPLSSLSVVLFSTVMVNVIAYFKKL
jgi:Cu+-exporting ATPase